MDMNKFKVLLDDKYEWPCDYTYKFVVPAAQVENFKTMFNEDNMSKRSSKTGKFVSFTITRKMANSDDVILVYEKASSIEGIVSL